MAADEVRRRLAAILYADVAGYSRLTGEDELGTHRQLAGALDLISHSIGAAGGRVVHYAGDAVLAEFSSVVAAVETAVRIQRALAEKGASVPRGRRLAFRIGINLGEVIVDRDDIYGDGVNVAARLESLAEPGGICISAAVQEQVAGKLAITFKDMGAQAVKNIERPVRTFSVVTAPAADPDRSAATAEPSAWQQDIRFCQAFDGVQLAYSSAGDGSPLIKTANWLNHIEFDWDSPVWSHLLRALATDFRLIRYDQRGNGLSDWDVPDISFEAWFKDFEAVVEAAGLDRFAILGISQGCAVAVAYAARYPERVSHLVLYGGYAQGRNKRANPAHAQQDEALIAAISTGWGQDNPAFRQLFTSLFVPGGSPEQMEWFNELQRRTTTAENAVRIRKVQNDIDVVDEAQRVSAPTLVLHVRDDAIVPFDEGRRLAAMIPTARFVPLEGKNHLFLEQEPACQRFEEEVRAFLGATGSAESGKA
jgi:class 3 adenylate cyclase/pimeloyl-ACP methyl ester carboxylesterase